VPVDATSGVYGGISYDLPQQRHTLVGAWIHLSRTWVNLPPKRGRVVPFTLHAPPRTPPGQYVGAVAGFVPTPTTGQTRSSAIRVQPRRVVAVVVTVPGPQQRRLNMSGVVAKHRPNAVYLIVQIRNRGNMLLAGQGHLWLWKSGWRKPILSAALQLETTVPHTMVHYPVQWSRRPHPWRYRFRALLWWRGGRSLQDGPLRVR
jgi:hypothetical protein